MTPSLLEMRGLPADLDCETFVLGAVLKNYSLYHPQVADLITAADFSIERHRLIWATVERLMADGQAVDRVTVYKSIAERGQADTDLISYLMELDTDLPPMPNVSSYAGRVHEKATLRDAIVACQAIIETLCSAGAGAEDVVAAEKIIRRISEGQNKQRRLVSIGDVIRGGVDGGTDGARAFLDASQEQNGLPTPWKWLTRATGGLKPGNLVILAARPSVGKTSAAAQMVLHLIDLEIGAVFVTLEMSKRDISRKIVAAKAGINLSEWQNGELSAEDRRAVASASRAVCPAETFLDDRPRATVPGIHAAILRHMAEHDTRLVVVDYLQLLTPAGRGSTRTEDVSEITRGLKIMAMELGVPVVALSQLSRASVQQGRKPRLDDLRDSGSIEQDADIVLFLHRAERPIVELIIAKQRLGPIGECRLVFDQRTALFSESEAPYDGT